MKRNLLLRIANFFCQFFKFLILISTIIITTVFIHLQFDSGSYTKWKLENPKDDFVLHFERESFVGQKPIEGKILRLSDWKTSSLYFTYIKYITTLLLIYLSIIQFSKVLKSLRKLESFHQTNVKSFRRIGFYSLLISVLSAFNYWAFTDYTKNSVSISFDIVLIALLAFILAEIFKEGNKLREENQLTI